MVAIVRGSSSHVHSRRDAAAEAFKRTASNALTDDDLGDLRRLALATERSIDDN